MKKLLVILLMLISASAFSQNMVEENGLYLDTVLIAGSTDAGSTWFKNKGFDKVYLQIYNGSKWYQIEVAGNDLKTFDKFMVQMEGSDTTISVLANTNDKNASDISVYIPVWTTSSVLAYSLDFGNGGAYGTSTSPLIVRFKGLYKKDY